MLERILTALGTAHRLDPQCEVTCEMDPGTFDLAKARAFKQIGVNRTSVGIQTFDADILKRLGRSHGRGDIDRALEDLALAGIPDNSVDLMSGLPGQTVATLEDSIHQAMAWEHVTHVSTYDLMLEPGTRFTKLYAQPGEASPGTAAPGDPGVAPLPDDDEAADMMECLHSTLAGVYGMSHYEVSNFARPKPGAGSRYSYCRHNLNYWNGSTGWLAYGMASTAFHNGQRVRRPPTMGRYAAWVERGCAPRLAPEYDHATASHEDRLTERLITAMRTAQGLPLACLDTFPPALRDKVMANAQRHLSGASPTLRAAPTHLQPAVPRGYMLSNTLISDLIQF